MAGGFRYVSEAVVQPQLDEDEAEDTEDAELARGQQKHPEAAAHAYRGGEHNQPAKEGAHGRGDGYQLGHAHHQKKADNQGEKVNFQDVSPQREKWEKVERRR